MSFITQVTISVVIYFIIRFFLKKERYLYISAFVSALSYIMIYSLNYEIVSVLPAIHFMVTGLSILFVFIAYSEIIILERKVRKIKKGVLGAFENFSVEKNYKIVFKLLGIGLLFLSLALISGLSLQTVFTTNLILKTVFTFVAWLIFVVTVIGVNYFNFSIKNATRSLFIAMWAVLGAYYMNSYLIGSLSLIHI